MDLHQETKKEAIEATAAKHGVDAGHLDYIGFADETEMVGKIMLYFNIMDPAHPKFKSTVCWIL
jgi:hypothetical protein